ncbi:MAG: DNA replication/repair protein RecF [bacterium]
MYLESLLLKNFRIYDELKLELGDGITVFRGGNAAGKTSILEAVYLLGTTKSHRTNFDREMIKADGRDVALVQGDFVRDGIRKRLEVVIPRGFPKRLRVNDGNVRRATDFLGSIGVVMFSPDDINIVKGDPSYRRRFMNVSLSQVSPHYADDLINYNRILKQRNLALKRFGEGGLPEDLLDVLDDQIARVGLSITERRRSMISNLSDIVDLIYRDVSGGESLLISYSAQVVGLGDYMRLLHESRPLDIRRGMTSFGPHRDDLAISVKSPYGGGEMDLRAYGSQGQHKTAVISLRLGEVEFMRSNYGDYPIVLMDDVFSELDCERRGWLLSRLRGFQCLLTVIDGDFVSSLDCASVFDVSRERGVILSGKTVSHTQ